MTHVCQNCGKVIIKSVTPVEQVDDRETPVENRKSQSFCDLDCYEEFGGRYS